MSVQSGPALCSRAEELLTDKSTWMNLGQTCAKFCHPAKSNITTNRQEGSRLSSEVYNSVPIEAAEVAGAGLQQYLAAGKYFALEFENAELNDDTEASDWLYEEQEGIYSVLNNSNYDSKNGEFFRDIVVLPGATLYSEPDPEDVIRFDSVPFEQVLISTNARGQVDELHRIFEYTVRQAFVRWGEKCGSDIADLYKKGKWSQKFKFLHSVAPRYERVIGKKDNYNMAFYSCYCRMDKKRKIEEKGYNDFPYTVGRWRVNSGETWAYTPASIYIADILMLNNMDMTVLMAGQQATSPSWLFPDENFVAPLNLNPMHINFRIPNPSGQTQSEKDPMPLVSGQNLNIGLDLLQARENRIKAGFFYNLFLPLLQKEVTAYEYSKVLEKSMSILGGVVGGITKDNLGPTINRTRIIRRQDPRLIKNGSLKPVPLSVSGQNVRINYTSPLALAQRAVAEQNQEAFLGAVSQMMQVNPSVRHKIKWDVAVDKMAKNRAIDPAILTSDSEYKDLLAADAKAQAEQNKILMAQAGGQAMQSVGAGVQALNPKKDDKKK